MSTKKIKIKFDGGEFFMSKPKKYIISVEVFKYPYCGKSSESIESEEFLSEKICCYTIRICKKIIKKAKRLEINI